MAQSFYVTDITIGREGNAITFSPDGNMVFSDRFVSSVTLAELLNGASSGTTSNPSFTKEIFVGDWALERHDNIYNRDFWSVNIYYNIIGIIIPDIKKVAVHPKLYISPSVSENIEFEDVIIYSDRIKIVSSDKVHCYINISTT